MKLFFPVSAFLFLNLINIFSNKNFLDNGNIIKNPIISVAKPGIIKRSALLLIIPGFATDIIGFLIIFPLSRKFLLEKIFIKFKNKKAETGKNNFIEGDFEDIEEEDDKKI